MGEWRMQSVEELAAPTKAALATGPFGSAIGSKTFRKTGIPVIRGGNLSSLTGVRLNDEGLVYIDEELASRFSRSLARRGDLIFTCWGTTDQVGLIDGRSQFDRYIVSNKQMKFTPDENKINPLFAYYYFSSPEGKEQIADNAIGSSVPGFNLTGLKSIVVPVPPMREQEQIIGVLGALDDKIELNRRMNETLELTARAIFKDWFVDFGPTRAKAEGRAPYLTPELWDLFPDALDDEYKPAGWRRDSLGALFDVSIGRTPPRKESQHFVPGGHGRTWLSIKTMGDIQTFAVASEEDLTTAAVKQFRVPLIPAGTVLVSFKLTVGRVAIAARDMHSNEAIAHLVANDETPVANLFTYCFMKDFDYESLGSTSSIATAVNSKSIKGIEMIVPDAASHTAFAEIAEPLFDRILSNVGEIDSLSATRDLLLPKLMSGEIHLRDTDEAVEAVA